MSIFRKNSGNKAKNKTSVLVRCEKCKTFFSRNNFHDKCPVCYPTYDKKDPYKGYLDAQTTNIIKKLIKTTFFIGLGLALIIYLPPIKNSLLSIGVFNTLSPILLLILIFSGMVFLPTISLALFNEKIRMNFSWIWKIILPIGTIGMLYISVFEPYNMFRTWDYANWNINGLLIVLIILLIILSIVLIWFAATKKQYYHILTFVVILIISGFCYKEGYKNAKMYYGTTSVGNKKILDPYLSNGKSILLFEYNPQIEIESFVVSQDGEDYDISTRDSFIACVVPDGKIQLKIGVEGNPFKDGMDVITDKFIGIRDIRTKPHVNNYNIDIKKGKLSYVKYNVEETSDVVKAILDKWGDKVIFLDLTKNSSLDSLAAKDGHRISQKEYIRDSINTTTYDSLNESQHVYNSSKKEIERRLKTASYYLHSAIDTNKSIDARKSDLLRSSEFLRGLNQESQITQEQLKSYFEIMSKIEEQKKILYPELKFDEQVLRNCLLESLGSSFNKEETKILVENFFGLPDWKSNIDAILQIYYYAVEKAEKGNIYEKEEYRNMAFLLDCYLFENSQKLFNQAKTYDSQMFSNYNRRNSLLQKTYGNNVKLNKYNAEKISKELNRGYYKNRFIK